MWKPEGNLYTKDKLHKIKKLKAMSDIEIRIEISLSSDRWYFTVVRPYTMTNEIPNRIKVARHVKNFRSANSDVFVPFVT